MSQTFICSTFDILILSISKNTNLAKKLDIFSLPSFVLLTKQTRGQKNQTNRHCRAMMFIEVSKIAAWDNKEE